MQVLSSNNTNKLSPQEHLHTREHWNYSSNNTNKLSPQERNEGTEERTRVQIIQINLALKNALLFQILVCEFK